MVSGWECDADAAASAVERLGLGAVAVRSSATAEDLPGASFAGQHETVLDVCGEDELITAIRTWWRSLDAPRAVAYREARWHVDGPAAMAVVVQRMVDPGAAGVAFTANPITGTRTEFVVDAVAGLGTSVVDGSAAADHYVMLRRSPGDAGGCLWPEQLQECARTGRRIEQAAVGRRTWSGPAAKESCGCCRRGRSPRSSRCHPTLAVTTSVSYWRQVTCRGCVADHSHGHVRAETRRRQLAGGVRIGPSRGYMVDIAGRMFLDLTGMIRDRRMRTRLPRMLGIYGPGVAHAVDRLLTEDPRLATRSAEASITIVIRVVSAKLAPGVLVAWWVPWSIRPRPDVEHFGDGTTSRPRHRCSRRQWQTGSRLPRRPRMSCSAGR